MGRLIEVVNPQERQSPLKVGASGVLLFRASGGQVLSGSCVVELIGPLLEAVVGMDGAIVAPMGAPNVVLFRALQSGEAVIEVFTGDPWQAPKATQLRLTVEDLPI